MTKAARSHWLHAGTLKVTNLHFFYVLAFAAQTIAYDGWKLVTPEALMQRWALGFSLLVISVVAWYMARSSQRTSGYYRNIVFGLIAFDIFFASMNIYLQRGMASRSVLLLVIPVVISAVLMTRAALLATAILSVAAYIFTAVAYFTMHPSEGYKIELYGEVLFYSAILLLASQLLWAVLRTKKQS